MSVPFSTLLLACDIFQADSVIMYADCYPCIMWSMLRHYCCNESFGPRSPVCHFHVPNCLSSVGVARMSALSGPRVLKMCKCEIQ